VTQSEAEDVDEGRGVFWGPGIMEWEEPGACNLVLDLQAISQTDTLFVRRPGNKSRSIAMVWLLVLLDID
jgi:hypothetical protein